MNATAFPKPEGGYDYLINESNFNLVKASMEGLSANPFVAGLIFFMVVWGAGVMVFVRTKNLIAGSFVVLLLNAMMHVYTIYEDISIVATQWYYVTYVVSVVVFALGVYIVFKGD